MRLPKRLCGASCQRRAQDGTTTAVPCCSAVGGRGEDLILSCGVRIAWAVYCSFLSRFCLVFNMNRIDLISSFWMDKKTNITPAPRGGCTRSRLRPPLRPSTIGIRCSFPSERRYVSEPQLTWQRLGHILVERRYPCGSWTNTGILKTTRLSAG